MTRTAGRLTTDPGEGALREALANARAALNRDRTGLAAALNRIQTEIKGWRWLRPEGDGDEGGTWGSHPIQAHTQATLRQEIAWAFNAVLKIAADALRASGKLADEACRQADAALATGKGCDPIFKCRDGWHEIGCPNRPPSPPCTCKMPIGVGRDFKGFMAPDPECAYHAALAAGKETA